MEGIIVLRDLVLEKWFGIDLIRSKINRKRKQNILKRLIELRK